MFEETDSVFNSPSHFPQTYLTNPSKLRIYIPLQIPSLITETLIVLASLYDGIISSVFEKEDPLPLLKRICISVFLY